MSDPPSQKLFIKIRPQRSSSVVAPSTPSAKSREYIPANSGQSSAIPATPRNSETPINSSGKRPASADILLPATDHSGNELLGEGSDFTAMKIHDDLHVARTQEEEARNHNFQLRGSYRQTSEQFQQIQQYLQTTEPPELRPQLSASAYATAVDAHVAQVVAGERENIQADLQAQNLAELNKQHAKRKLIETSIESLKLQLAKRVDGQVAKEMDSYRRRVQEQIDKILEEKTAEFNAARATFQPQWEAKLKAVDSELQDVLSGASSRTTGITSNQPPAPFLPTPTVSPRSTLGPSPFQFNRHAPRNSGVMAQSIAKLRGQNVPNLVDNAASSATRHFVPSSPLISASRGYPNEAVNIPGNFEQNDTNSSSYQRFLSAVSPRSTLGPPPFQSNRRAPRNSGVMAPSIAKLRGQNAPNLVDNFASSTTRHFVPSSPLIPASRGHPNEAVDIPGNFEQNDTNSSSYQRFLTAQGTAHLASQLRPSRRAHDDLPTRVPSHRPSTSNESGFSLRGVEQQPLSTPLRPGITPGDLSAPVVTESEAGRFLRAIRKLMQRLLGIAYDNLIGESVRLGHSTPLIATMGPQKPSLTPFCPCWEDLGGEWNQALAELFLERFKLDHPELAILRNETYICSYFHQRLRTLREALVRCNRELAGEKVREKTASMGRRRERRRTVYDKRMTWTLNNQESYPILLLFRMVKLLGTDGMSSESSAESGGDGKRWTVVNKNWRHPDVVRLLNWIDLQWRQGERSAVPFHCRLRRPHGKSVSLRLPIAGLPVNFYHPVWYNTLSPDKKRRLRAADVKALPVHLLPRVPHGTYCRCFGYAVSRVIDGSHGGAAVSGRILWQFRVHDDDATYHNQTALLFSIRLRFSPRAVSATTATSVASARSELYLAGSSANGLALFGLMCAPTRSVRVLVSPFPVSAAAFWGTDGNRHHSRPRTVIGDRVTFVCGALGEHATFPSDFGLGPGGYSYSGRSSLVAAPPSAFPVPLPLAVQLPDLKPVIPTAFQAALAYMSVYYLWRLDQNPRRSLARQSPLGQLLAAVRSAVKRVVLLLGSPSRAMPAENGETSVPLYYSATLTYLWGSEQDFFPSFCHDPWTSTPLPVLANNKWLRALLVTACASSRWQRRCRTGVGIPSPTGVLLVQTLDDLTRRISRGGSPVCIVPLKVSQVFSRTAELPCSPQLVRNVRLEGPSHVDHRKPESIPSPAQAEANEEESPSLAFSARRTRPEGHRHTSYKPCVALKKRMAGSRASVYYSTSSSGVLTAEDAPRTSSVYRAEDEEDGWRARLVATAEDAPEPSPTLPSFTPLVPPPLIEQGRNTML
ncbi:hypothetical protein C8R46DRAFT_1035765 [Mycena filopes]|nr:hypothetical protein C8R46DRAFT_1035765 [Mycena filopes]